MQVFHKLDDVPTDFGPTLVSVGNFDGVHRAHAHVLREIALRAQATGAKAVAVTFEPHPTRILRPETGLKLLTPTPEKLRWLESTGVDAVLLLPFGRDLSLMTPREFAEQILKQKLHAREVHEGFNFRFGHKAEGDMDLLVEFGREMGFEVKVCPEMALRGESVSSSGADAVTLMGFSLGGGYWGSAVLSLIRAMGSPGSPDHRNRMQAGDRPP